MKTATATREGSITIQVEDATPLREGMEVVGSFPDARYTKIITGEVKEGTNVLPIHNVDFIGIATRARGGVPTDSANWRNTYVVDGYGLQAGSVIVRIDKPNSTVTVQNSVFRRLDPGDEVTVTGQGRIPTGTTIVSINKETNTVTLSQETNCTVPRNTDLTFKGSA